MISRLKISCNQQPNTYQHAAEPSSPGMAWATELKPPAVGPMPEKLHVCLPATSMLALMKTYIEDDSFLMSSSATRTNPHCRTAGAHQDWKGTAVEHDLELPPGTVAEPTGRLPVAGSSEAAELPALPHDPVPRCKTGLRLPLIHLVFHFNFAGEAVKEVIPLRCDCWGSFLPTEERSLSPWSSLLVTKSQTAKISWNC